MKIDFNNPILAYFLKNPNNRFYFNEIVVKVHRNPKLLSKDLKELMELGIIGNSKEGNMKYFWLLNTDTTKHIRKTWIFLGLRKCLSKLDLSEISQIFLYGSFANLTYNSKSDIDILVTFRDEEKYNAKATKELRDYFDREVSFITYKDKEFLKLLKEGNKFANNVFKKGIKIYDSIMDDKLLI